MEVTERRECTTDLAGHVSASPHGKSSPNEEGENGTDRGDSSSLRQGGLIDIPNFPSAKRKEGRKGMPTTAKRVKFSNLHDVSNTAN